MDKNKIWIICAVLLAILVVGGGLFYSHTIKQDSYNSAMSLYSAKQYLPAYKIFIELDEFSGASAMAKACREAIYNEAMSLMEARKYDEAYNSFIAIVDYKDSKSKSEEAKKQAVELNDKYNAAMSLLKAKKYEDSLSKFQEISFYKDSATKIKESEDGIKSDIYEAGVALLNAQKYKDALDKFKQVETYKDTQNRIEACLEGIRGKDYEEAMKYLNDKNYCQAMQKFSALGDYKDSKTKLQEANKYVFGQLDECLKEINLEMVTCSPGTFIMGSQESEYGELKEAINEFHKRLFRFDYAEIQHEVTLSKGFKIGKYPVTQAQYKKIMGKNPSHFNGDNNPVEKVSWHDAKEFCDKLNEKYASKLPSGYEFDLPTEAQWEYACRAGTTSALNNGKALTSEIGKCQNLDEIAWYCENSDNKTHPVGQKKPNAWGIYDMHGNVWEWCRDWYGDYPTGNVTDPVGPSTGSIRVFRGGSWIDLAGYCRSAGRYYDYPDNRNIHIGFRLAIVPVHE